MNKSAFLFYLFAKCFIATLGQEIPICQTNFDKHDQSIIYSRNFVAGKSNKWPHKRIPFEIDEAFSTTEKNIILKSFEVIMENTCIKFVERVNELSFLKIFTGGKGCNSNLGYNSHRRVHKLHLQRKTPSSSKHCLYLNTVVHELLHCLGMGHEQNRPDRDDFVRINWGNIKEGYASQFWRFLGMKESGIPSCQDVSPSNYDDCHSGFKAQTFGLDYDYASIMHYGSHYFSSNGKSTIAPKKRVPSGVVMGKMGISKLDIAKLNAAYNCFSNAFVISDCIDIFTECDEYKSHCKYSLYMKENCKRTCNLC